MKNRSVRIAVTSLVAVLSVIGLAQGPADAKVVRHQVARTSEGWCC